MTAALFAPSLWWVARRSVQLLATLALAAMLLTLGGAGVRPATADTLPVATVPATADTVPVATGAAATTQDDAGTRQATVAGPGRVAASGNGPETTVAARASLPVDGPGSQPPLVINSVPATGSPAPASGHASVYIAPSVADRPIRAIGPRAPPLR